MRRLRPRRSCSTSSGGEPRTERARDMTRIGKVDQVLLHLLHDGFTAQLLLRDRRFRYRLRHRAEAHQRQQYHDQYFPVFHLSMPSLSSLRAGSQAPARYRYYTTDALRLIGRFGDNLEKTLLIHPMHRLCNAGGGPPGSATPPGPKEDRRGARPLRLWPVPSAYASGPQCYGRIVGACPSVYRARIGASVADLTADTPRRCCRNRCPQAPAR